MVSPLWEAGEGSCPWLASDFSSQLRDEEAIHKRQESSMHRPELQRFGH